MFLSVNRNKRSVALGLGTPAGREAALRIGSRCDVVVESFRPGVASRLGLDFEAFGAVSPRIVHRSISAFGEGPLGHSRPGYDALVQAFTGIMEMTGDADGLPARAAPSVVDVSTGGGHRVEHCPLDARPAPAPVSRPISSVQFDRPPPHVDFARNSG